MSQPPMENKLMKVKIVRNTVASGKPVFEGESHELPEAEAKFLIAIGKAEAAKAEKAAAPAAAAPEPEPAEAEAPEKAPGKSGKK